MKIKYFFFGVIFTILILLISIMFFMLGKYRNDNLSETFYSEDSDTDNITDITPTALSLTYDEVKETIEYAVINNEFDLLKKYLNDYVTFKIENTNCCEPQTKDLAIERLEFLNNSKGEWNFDQENSVAKSLAASFPENYSQAVIGFTSDLYSVAFQLDKINKITKISLSSTYEILLNKGTSVVE